MKQFTYRVYPKSNVHSIVADDVKDAVNRAAKLHRVPARYITVDESEQVVFQNYGGKRSFGRFERK